MTDRFFIPKRFERKLRNVNKRDVSKGPKSFKEPKKINSLEDNSKTYTLGRTVYGVVHFTTKVAFIAGIIGYGAMSVEYGPYDAGKVVYAEIFQERGKNLKHRHIETAKALYAKRLQKQELDQNDMRNFYVMLGVVSTGDRIPEEGDVSWKGLLKFIDDNE